MIRARKVRWLKNLLHDINENPSAGSQIHAGMEMKLDTLVPERVPLQILHFCMAKIHSALTAEGLRNTWESIYNQALVELWDDTESWPALEQERELTKETELIKESLSKLERNWKPENTKDRRHQSVKDQVRAKKLLVNMPKNTIL